MYCIQSLVPVEQFNGLVVVNPLKLMLLLQPHLENPDFFVCRPNLSWQLFLYEKVTGLFTSDGSRAYRQRDDEVLGTEPPWSPGTEPLAGSTPHPKKSSTFSSLTVNFAHKHSRYAKSQSACYTYRCQWGMYPPSLSFPGSAPILHSPVSPPDIFSLSAEVFSSCLAIVSAVMVGGLFLWPALRYGTGYQTLWEIWPSAETPSSIHWRRFYFQLTRVHSALDLSGRCALQIYLLTSRS